MEIQAFSSMKTHEHLSHFKTLQAPIHHQVERATQSTTPNERKTGPTLSNVKHQAHYAQMNQVNCSKFLKPIFPVIQRESLNLSVCPQDQLNCRILSASKYHIPHVGNW